VRFKKHQNQYRPPPGGASPRRPSWWRGLAAPSRFPKNSTPHRLGTSALSLPSISPILNTCSLMPDRFLNQFSRPVLYNDSPKLTIIQAACCWQLFDGEGCIVNRSNVVMQTRQNAGAIVLTHRQREVYRHCSFVVSIHFLP